MQGWLEVFTVSIPSPVHSASVNTPLETGWIQSCPQTFCPNVRVLFHNADADIIKDIYMPWNQRFPQFVEFVTSCADIFRLQVSVQDTRIQKYSVFVNPANFTKQMNKNGCFPGEMYVLALLSSRFETANLRTSNTNFNHSPRTNVLKEYPNWKIPLLKEQISSLLWMMEIEDKIRNKKAVFEYDVNLPICNEWYYDQRHEVFVNTEPEKVCVQQRGGVLVDDSGMGKTATAINLICRGLDVSEQVNSDLVYTKATLVIIPPQLVSQWTNEITKFVETGVLKVITLLTARDVKTYTVTDIKEADIVITSAMYLRSKAYTEMVEQSIQRVLGEIQVNDRRLYRSSSACRTFARTILTRKKYDCQVILETILWKRIIIDEVHELFQSCAKEKLKCIKGLSSIYWWGLTATPSIKTITEVQDYYFFIRSHDGCVPQHHPCLAHEVLNHVIKGTQTQQPTPEFSFHKISLTQTESDELHNCQDLTVEDEICITICGGHPQENDRIVYMSEKNISSILVEHDDSSFFREQSIQILQENIEMCSICMSNKVDSILSCGHLFCRKCLQTHLRRNINCPACRSDFRTTVPCAATLVCDNLIRSRMKAILTLCKEIKENNEKVLIFSQFQTIIRSIHNILNAFDFKVFTWEGSAPHKSATIKEFAEKGDILILPLDGSICGVDLVCANHIVFPHLMVSDVSSKQILHKQAICRTLRHGQSRRVYVHTFVVNDSLEEELLFDKYE